jgi:hypothetical protein
MDILSQLAGNEIAIGSLYRQYAKHFRQHGSFWNKMAEEEFQHADWINELDTAIFQDKVQGKEPTSFSREGIVSFGKYLQKELNRLTNEDYSPQEAFEVAYLIENTLIERKLLEVIVISKDKAVKSTVSRLEEATKTHMARIQQAKDSLAGKK